MSEGEPTCDFGTCEKPTSFRSSNGRFCSRGHLMADANGWPPHGLSEYEVEYEGEEGTFIAPNREQAERQWESVVKARRR